VHIPKLIPWRRKSHALKHRDDFFGALTEFWDMHYMTPEYKMVGFKNYAKLLASRDFSQALSNTLVFCVFSAVFSIALGLGMALLLEKKFKGKSFFSGLVFSPWITPTVAVSLVWMWIYDADHGMANAVLHLFSLPGLKWVGSSKTAMLSVIIVTVWKSIGYNAILYLAALEKVPRSLYEAASLDRASKWGTFLRVTLPGISPTTFFLAVISTINGLQAYDQIQVLTQGGPAGSTRTLLYLYYQLGFQQYKMGQAASAAVVLMLAIAVLSALQWALSKRAVSYR
jgi:multiple sugar transport system permease protein